MRNIVFFLAGIAVAIALILWWRSSDKAKPKAATTTTPTSTTSSPTSATPPSPSPASTPSPERIDRVRRLDPAASKALREKIAAARERARASAAASSAPPPPEEMKLEDIAAALQQSLKDAIPLLAECYGAQNGKFTATARMTLISDPDLGTVIDTDVIKDKDDRPLEPKTEECLRDVMDSLGMPPLGAGGKVKLEYSFRSD